jgi:pimeloyl-ACP methyl ester carboxylesterase
VLSHLAQWIDTVPTSLRLRRTQNGPAASSRTDIRFVDLGDCIVRLRQAGARGPSLVLATDPPVPLEMYDALLAKLSNRYRVTIFELPGFGCSLPRMGYRFSLPRAMQAVTRLLEQLPAAPHVLGLPCVTAYVALAIARARADLVGRLLLLQTPTWQGAQSWLDGRDPKHLLRRPILGQLGMLMMRRRRAHAWYKSALADHTLVEPFAQATLDNFDHGGCFCLASGYQDFLQNDHGLLKPVAQDTLIIWGKDDPSHRDTQMEATVALAPNSHAEYLDGVGHFPELEATDRFAGLLDTFLSPESNA